MRYSKFVSEIGVKSLFVFIFSLFFIISLIRVSLKASGSMASESFKISTKKFPNKGKNFLKKPILIH